MAAVLEVIACSGKACLTKDALELTRLGIYINGLRKSTNNEQLARRDKGLVKCWHKLLPKVPESINRDVTITTSSAKCFTISSNIGEGTESRILKGVTVNRTPILKKLKLIMDEQSSSPYFSSASNSPLLNTLHHISSQPSNYTPNFAQCNVSTENEKTDFLKKSLFCLNNQNQNNVSVNQTSFTVLTQSIKSSISDPFNKISCISNVSPEFGTDAGSCTTSVSMNFSQNLSPSIPCIQHNNSKMSIANKHFQKEKDISPEEIISNSKLKIENGVTKLIENILPHDISSLKTIGIFNSTSKETDDIVTALKNTNRKRSFNKNEHEDSRLRDLIASLPSGSKLPKVKTTRQLIVELQAKKGLGSTFADSFTSQIDSLFSHEHDASSHVRSDLKNCLVSQPVSQESNNDSTTDESSISVISDFGSHFIPDVSTVINKHLDVWSSISHLSSVDVEIERILSVLPPVNTSEINLEIEHPVQNEIALVTNDTLSRLSEPWEHVNGIYDINGSWRPWQECCEQKSLGENFLLLPYVNID